MLPHQGRPPVATGREADVSPGVPGEFDRVRAVIEHEIKEIDAEMEQLKAEMSGLETRRAQLQHDLDHLSAATHILEKFDGRAAKTARVPFACAKTDCVNLTQREAIFQILRQNPSQALNKKTLTQALIDGGFPFRSVERAERQNAVYQTCRRMVEAHELVMLIQGRDGYYQLADDRTPARTTAFQPSPSNGTAGKNGNGASTRPS